MLVLIIFFVDNYSCIITGKDNVYYLKKQYLKGRELWIFVFLECFSYFWTRKIAKKEDEKDIARALELRCRNV